MSQKLLLAESGSSKTEWRLCEGNEVVKTLRSPGFNPNIQTEAAMRLIFQDVIQHIGYEIDYICFYGAGLAELSQRKLMHNLLKELVPEAQIQIEHDMLAAVRCTLKPEGIVCILGTGSNSARYENEEITENLGGHGYIFGDEGSGANIGKMMIKAMLQSDLPIAATEHFEQNEQSTISEIKIGVMRSEKPNVKLATFAKLTADIIDIPGVKQIVKQNFLNFLDTTVCRYEGYESLYTDFVGSIAFYFRDTLEEACSDRKVKMGNILRDPVENLISYHLTKIKSE